MRLIIIEDLVYQISERGYKLIKQKEVEIEEQKRVYESGSYIQAPETIKGYLLSLKDKYLCLGKVELHCK